MKKMIYIFLLIAGYVLVNEAVSEEIYTQPVGACIGILESDATWEILTIRMRHPEYKRCDISKQNLNEFLKKAFSVLPEKNLSVNYTSVFIGRIIDYPWMSRYLADTAKNCPEWSVEKGRPLTLKTHEFVQDILNNDEIVSMFNKHLHRIGYAVTGVTVEKVLISTGKPVNQPEWIEGTDRLPFDAMMWFTIEKR